MLAITMWMQTRATHSPSSRECGDDGEGRAYSAPLASRFITSSS